jgi:predicted dehydrogenase
VKNTSKPILIVGLGSIGRRHLKNLSLLGYENIILSRTGKSVLAADELAGYKTFYDLEEALLQKPIAAIVSSPTSLHVSTALKAINAGCHLFLEKPISHSLEGISKLERNAKAKNLQVHVGFQFRFHPGLQQIKKWIENNQIGQVMSVRSHWGECIKDWLSWEDYRKSYSVREEMGGGVVLTLSHPFDYLLWLLGDVEKVYAVTGKHQDLGINTECMAETILHFNNGVMGSVYLDYLERPARHTLDIIGDIGTIRWDNADGTAKLFVENKCSSECAVPKGFERNTMFLEEMRHFLMCINDNSPPMCSIEEGIKSLKIALAVKRSAAEGSEVNMSCVDSTRKSFDSGSLETGSKL